MSLRYILLFFVLHCFSGISQAQENPLWLRYPVISPDGSTIAFSYKGNIYSVPTLGGEAKLLTSNPAHETYPIWSPDGKKIAFASTRNGGMDIYVMNAHGGTPKQVTTHAANEKPLCFTPDGKNILFKANILPDANFSEFPRQGQVYSIPVEGGRYQQFLTLDANAINFAQDGEFIVYYDNKGYEDEWRKHHKSSVCRDIWKYNIKTGVFTNITNKEVEDRDPILANNDQDLYFLSERFGSFNLCKLALNNSQEVKQLTHHTKHPLRFLSKSKDNLFCYAYDGEIYTYREGGKPAKVQIDLYADEVENQVEYLTRTGGATHIALSPDGKELAFVIRGDVFVTSTEYRTTRRITNTPQQERSISFSPNGRQLVYAGERDGQWQIYMTSLTDPTDKLFTYAKSLSEKQLTKGKEPRFQPVFSPDGKEIAYLKNRTEIAVLNLKSGKERTVLPGNYNYSYSDGDQSFEWSPDGAWILVQYFEKGGWQNNDIALVKSDGSLEINNLTESGYNDVSPTWAMNGDAILWISDRNGYRSHGSWGSQFDVYGMFLTDEAWNKFRLSKEELELEKQNQPLVPKDTLSDKTKKKKKESKKNEPISKIKTIDFDQLRDRKVRMTINPSNLAGSMVLSPNADKLFYLSRFEGGFDLWVRSFKDGSTRILTKGAGAGHLQLSKNGQTLYLLDGGGIKKINVNNGQMSNKGFSAPLELRKSEERNYIFNHTWQQVADKFYDPQIHGIDWKGYKEAYAKFLPHINNNYDFTDLLGELLGELNASHTGARYSAKPGTAATHSLGAFFDPDYKGDGLKVIEVLKRGPLTQPGSEIAVNEVIEAINGERIKASEDYYPLLNNLTQSRILLTVYNPKNNKRREIFVKTIPNEQVNGLLYTRWVEQRKEMVDKLSGGELGYVHVKGMDSESFRTVFSELLGKYRNKKAVVIDTRSNGGGWLHDDLITLLSGKKYAEFTPRGQFIAQDPLFKWTKPSAVLMSENNYSNAHGFPWAYKELGVGKLIGTPVPGTMTAVWWERQQDPSLVFGIPQLGVRDLQGNYLENMQLEPDIKVSNDPNATVKGKDPQLEAAVKVLLQEIESN